MGKMLLLAATLAFTLGVFVHAQAREPLPENDKLRVVAAKKIDCFIYQADCLRITVECKQFLVLGTPVLEVTWRNKDGSTHYALVKHITGGSNCSPGDLIQRYIPWFEGKGYEIVLP